MRLLLTIDLLGLPESERSVYRFRQAARAIILNSDNKIAIIHNGKYNYHKLPGGGVEDGENITEVLKRECYEEVGCEIEVIGEVGRVLEYRDEYQLKHESFCFIAKTSSHSCQPNFTPEEIADGFFLKWLELT